MDSPLEGDGFELPVSRQIGSGPGSLARDRGFADSPVEGTRFELSVPRPRLARVGAPCPRLRFLPRQHAFFRRNIMFNLPTFSSSPTPDPSSAWYPLDRNDLPCSWYVLSEFDGLVKPISGQPAGPRRSNTDDHGRHLLIAIARCSVISNSEHVRILPPSCDHRKPGFPDHRKKFPDRAIQFPVQRLK